MSVFNRGKIAGLPAITVTLEGLTDSACEAVRLSFNPSGIEKVTRIKTLAAALISELETIGGDAGREAAIARTHVQSASMFGVLAATKGID